MAEEGTKSCFMGLLCLIRNKVSLRMDLNRKRERDGVLRSKLSYVEFLLFPFLQKVKGLVALGVANFFCYCHYNDTERKIGTSKSAPVCWKWDTKWRLHCQPYTHTRTHTHAHTRAHTRVVLSYWLHDRVTGSSKKKWCQFFCFLIHFLFWGSELKNLAWARQNNINNINKNS